MANKLLLFATLTQLAQADYIEQIPPTPDAVIGFDDVEFFPKFQPVAISPGSKILGTYSRNLEVPDAIAFWSSEAGFEAVPNPPLISQDFNGFFIEASPTADAIVAWTFDRRSYRWTKDLGWIELLSEGAGRIADASGVARGGIRAIGETYPGPDELGGDKPAVWDLNGTLKILPIPEGFSEGSLDIISGDGSLAFGEFETDDFDSSPFLWRPESGAQLLTIPASWDRVEIDSVDDQGTLALGTARISGVNQFCTWTPTSGLQAIQGSQASSTYETTMSADGSLAILSGGSGSPNFEYEYFVWRPGQQVISFRAFIETENNLSGLLFGSDDDPADLFDISISSDGKIITGRGGFSSDFELRSPWVVHLDGSNPSVVFKPTDTSNITISWPLVSGLELFKSDQLNFDQSPLLPTVIDGRNQVTEPRQDKMFYLLAPAE